MGEGIEEELKHFEKASSKEYHRILRNPWAISTIILLAILIVGAFLVYTGKIGGEAVASQDEVKANLLSFVKDKGIENFTIKEVKESKELPLFEVTISINGEETPVYITKDAKYLVASPQVFLPLTGEQAETPTSQVTEPQKEVPKTDKPAIELYVFTYCPYGLQMEKAFAPVITLLGSKIDYKIRQIGAMHGEYEQIEAERQLCIEKEYPEKFLTYVNEFAINTEIGTCASDMTCSKSKVEALMTKLNISVTKINECMNSTGKSLYDAEVQNSQSKGVGGSPTVIINGVESQLSRSPDAIKTAICASFTTPPAECSQNLSTAQASPGFGADAGSAAPAASCG